MSDTQFAKDFRLETREWLATHCPDGARGPGQTPWGSSKITLERDSALWLERMAERGWTVPTWPTQYGGAGLDKELYPILIEELKRIGARTPLTGRGVNYIGPTILELGSEEQRRRWLPGIARGEGGWAMGYSGARRRLGLGEPGVPWRTHRRSIPNQWPQSVDLRCHALRLHLCSDSNRYQCPPA